jgi:hypothetical protein
MKLARGTQWKIRQATGCNDVKKCVITISWANITDRWDSELLRRCQTAENERAVIASEDIAYIWVSVTS